MISGKLPNDTVWWLSTDGLKIWIESGDLEQEKFKEKLYIVNHGRIFYARRDVGELTKSRLDSRRGKDAWIIKLEAMLDVYPDLVEEIGRKEIETKKKRTPKKKTKIVRYERKEILNLDIKKEKEVNLDINKEKEVNLDINKEKEVLKEPIKDLFDINRPYVTWIKEEINKSERGKIVIPVKDLKEKMGNEFLNMHDMRIYFGLKKILSTIGIIIELRSSKGDSIIIMKKII